MKRIIFLLVAVFCVCNLSFAGGGVKVTQGEKKFFKTAEGTAVLDFQFDNAQYDNKQPLKEKFDNIEHLKGVALNGFMETFNDKCKKVKVVKESADAKYKFTLVVSNMDQYFKVMGFVPGNATKVWGTFTITDMASGEVLLIANVTEVDGGANLSPDGSFSDCFEELAELVAKLK